MSKVLYVKVRVVVEDTVDTIDFTQNVDYDFSYPGVVDTEIVEVEERINAHA